MTSSRAGSFVVWMLLAMPSGGASPCLAAEAPLQALLDLMAEGKTETDLGHFDSAIQALTTVVDSPEAPPSLRAEALVRLGAARRGAGDAQGAFAAFERASREPGLDAERKALLVRAPRRSGPGKGPVGEDVAAGLVHRRPIRSRAADLGDRLAGCPPGEARLSRHAGLSPPPGWLALRRLPADRGRERAQRGRIPGCQRRGQLQGER